MFICNGNVVEIPKKCLQLQWWNNSKFCILSKKIEPRITISMVFIWGIKMISEIHSAMSFYTDQKRLTEWCMWATASSPGDWMHTFPDKVFIESNSTTPTGSKKKLPWAKYGHSKNDRMNCFCLLTLYPSIQSLFSDTLSSISYIKSILLGPCGILINKLVANLNEL